MNKQLLSGLSLVLLISSQAAYAQSWTAVPLANKDESLRITGPFNGPNPNGGDNRYHTGVDIFSDDRTVRAVAKGVVSEVVENDTSRPCQNPTPIPSGRADLGFGNMLIIEHDAPRGGKVYSLYAHLENKPSRSSGTPLKKDDEVAIGEQIGVMGRTGFGCQEYWPLHLHWETKTAAVLAQPTGTSGVPGYGPTRAEDRGYYVPIFADVLKDIRKAVGNDQRFIKEVDTLVYTLPEWDTNWALATMLYRYRGACSCLDTYVWVYHITKLADNSVRYTIWFDPETNSWAGTTWTLVPV